MFAFVLASFLSTDTEAQVPNGGFEDWSDNYLFSEPPPYFTSNFQYFLETGQGNVTEVPGVNGSAARLETVDDGNEIIPGSMVLANIDNGNLTGGAPFASEPDSLTGYFRYSIPNGDTATITMFFTASGFPVNIVSIPIIGEELSFTYHAFDLPTFFATPDTVIAFIASSGANTPSNWWLA